MVQQTIEVSNRAGVHARPSSMIAEATQKFECGIHFEQGSTRINAKSILGIITLGALYKSKITIICDGPDEQEALACIVHLFESKFEEE